MQPSHTQREKGKCFTADFSTVISNSDLAMIERFEGG
jgi:hypothetical protein